jgi:23S rRNA (cytidine1920-2'-O)/16S rRNA (cytidine1409-2'-O)-methyltransferase
VEGKRALDIGQSTGGFTHCLLLRGAQAVVGVEVGQAQIAPTLRGDSRVTTLEKQDIRALDPKRIAPPFEFFTVDLSFISLALVLPALPAFLAEFAEGVLLVKPQFEVGPDNVGSGGLVRDAALRDGAVERIRRVSADLGFTVAGEIKCPVLGSDGNQEYLMHLQWRA